MRHAVKRGDPAGLIMVLAALLAGFVVLVAIGVVLIDKGQSSGVNDESVLRNTSVIEQLRSGCRSTAIRNAYSIHRAATPFEKEATRTYFRIVNCDKTYQPGTSSNGERFYLEPADQACFVRLVANFYFRSNPVTTDPQTLRAICSGAVL